MVNRKGQINDRLSKDSDMLKKENMDQIDKMEKFNRKLESTKQNQMDNLELKIAKENI